MGFGFMDLGLGAPLEFVNDPKLVPVVGESESEKS